MRTMAGNLMEYYTFERTMIKYCFVFMVMAFFIFLFVSCKTTNGYIQKNNTVYYVFHAGPLPMFGLNWERHQRELINVDIKTFVDFNCRAYAKDKNHVYHRGDIVEKFDAQTFEILGEDYAKDKNHVYCLSIATYGAVIEGVDPATFNAKEYKR